MKADHELSICVEGLHKAYRNGASVTPVLKGVDLEVHRGECVFLVGPSGSGKTTLLSILGCILTPDSGSVRILGHEVGSLDHRQRAAMRRDGIGFVFQRSHLIRGLTAIDNVCVPLVLKGASPAAAREHGVRLLATVGLEHRCDYDARNLSAGECQRVALARALAGDPELILADEPTAALDAAAGAEVMEWLQDLSHQKEKAVVVVTHDTRIFQFADRLFRVEDGQVEAADQPSARPPRSSANQRQRVC